MDDLTILDDLELVELSIVDTPANPEAQVVVAKRHDNQEVEMTDNPVDNPKVEELEALKSENEFLRKSLIDNGYVIKSDTVEKKAPEEAVEIDGETIVKSAVPEVVWKKMKADAEALEAARVEKADVELTKRAEKELPNFAITEAKELVKAFSENAEVMTALKAADAVFAEAQEEVGKAAPQEVDAQAEYDALVAKYKDEHKVSHTEAYAAVRKTTEGEALLKEITKKG